MSWNKKDGTKLRALMYISDYTVQCVCLCVLLGLIVFVGRRARQLCAYVCVFLCQ